MTPPPTEICRHCGHEKDPACQNGSVCVGPSGWSGCDRLRSIEHKVWTAKMSVEGHTFDAWEEVYAEIKSGTKRIFVYSRSSKLGYSIMRRLPRGEIQAIPTSKLNGTPAKKPRARKPRKANPKANGNPGV